ncbi:MAG: hypothetical protein ACLVL7_05075 [Anaerotruncus massiliensis (ex Togo et al. 2019)]
MTKASARSASAMARQTPDGRRSSRYPITQIGHSTAPRSLQ